MSTPVTYVGNAYSVPAYGDSGYAQGAGNLSSYLVALATGSLTLSGGNFALLADANFGANFGLVSTYYKSRTAGTLATTGVLRLTVSDVIAWRNNIGNANLSLSVNASDQLVFSGGIVATGSNLPAADNTYDLGSAVLRWRSAYLGTSAIISATTNQIVLGTTNTTTISATAPAASRTYTIPDAGGAASFLMSLGSQTITGAKTFADQTLLLQETGGTDVVTINVAALGASRAYTIPDAGAAAAFLLTVGAQTITGAKTFADQTLLLQETGSTDVITINVAALAASRAYTLPDAGGAASFIMSAGAQTIGGIKTFNAGAGAITMSGSTIAMGSNKITGLAAATASGDAVRFEQISTTASNSALTITDGSGNAFSSITSTYWYRYFDATHWQLHISFQGTSHGSATGNKLRISGFGITMNTGGTLYGDMAGFITTAAGGDPRGMVNTSMISSSILEFTRSNGASWATGTPYNGVVDVIVPI